MSNNEIFTSSLNGYNKKEVIAYLEKLSADMDARESDCRHAVADAESETAALAARVSELSDEKETLLGEIQRLKDALSESEGKFTACSEELERIKPDADRIVKNASDKADAILNDAKARAEEILSHANENAAEISKQQSDDIAQKLASAYAAVDDLMARTQTVMSGLDVSKRHIDAADAMFRKLTEKNGETNE